MALNANESAKRQIDDGIRQSLRRAGIPERLIDRSATDMPGGRVLADRLLGEYRDHAIAGGILMVRGEGREARNTVLLSARGLHLQGIGCKVMGLAQLASVLANPNQDSEFVHRLYSVKCMAIQRFYYPDGEGDQIMTYRTRGLVEEFILERMDAGLAHILHVASVPPIEDPFKWWSRDFLRAINDGRKVWEVEQ